VTALLFLVACGGGGGGEDGSGVTASGDGVPTDPSFVVGTSIAPLSYTGFQGDGTLRSAADENVVNLQTGAISGGLFAGTLNPARTRIDLAGGGTVSLTDPGATEYVRIFAATPAIGAPVFGVVGFASAPADLPRSGRVSYTGRTQVLAADATRLFTLDGRAFILADFEDRRVRIELQDLGGTASGVSPGNTGPVAVPRGGLITVDGSAISGATFSGGRASAAGLPFGLTASADASGTSGGFFGPGADEAAGRVVVRDAAGDVEILGTFAAD
jgi:hypothetical protein